MDEYVSLSHTQWDCKCHVISFPNVAGRSCTVN